MSSNPFNISLVFSSLPMKVLLHSLFALLRSLGSLDAQENTADTIGAEPQASC